MRKTLGENRIRWIWGLCLVLLWACAVLLFIKLNGRMSVEELLRYQPKSKAAAALAMCALFLLKSMDFLLHSGVLYAIDGVLFSLPAALALSTVGNVIISTVPYFIGKNLGMPVLERIADRNPRVREFEPVRKMGTVFFSFLIRCVSLPAPILGLYMGASRADFGKYLLGSVLGLIPLTLVYTLLGDSRDGQRLPMLAAAIATEVLVAAAALLIGRCIRKKKTGEGHRETDTPK